MPMTLPGSRRAMRALLDPVAAAAAARARLEQAAHYSWRACANAVRCAYQSAIEVHAHRR